MRRVLVVGCGMAGARFVRRLTALNPDVRITVFDGERHPAYNRPLLTGVLAGHYRSGDIALPLPPGIELRAGVRAGAVHRATRTVIDSAGVEHGYDALVLATGSRPEQPWRHPSRPERSSAGEHRLHTLTDCLRLSEECVGARSPVVVGGGLLGVETALVLAGRGLPVTLVHQGRHLMHRRLDAKAGALLRTVLEDAGVAVRAGTSARSLTGRTGVTGVRLADSSVLAADLVVSACGTRPRVGLARRAGLAVHAGVVVDDTLRSVTDPHIHAIGDCAEHRGVVHDTAVPAWQQAEVLAARLSGHDRHARFTGARTLTRLIADRLDLAVFGEATTGVGTGTGVRGGIEGAAQTDVLCLSDDRHRVYKKIVTRNDHVVGGILLGDLSTVDTVRRAYEATEPLPPNRLHLVTELGGEG
ncbi:NAD(P)/FAD-dependent oxidoreductase [Streptomyces dysideae]|uniref:Nitrite reductase n=1 Tax=Streptomyces dysideae TaxID=909626 RepID=A0A101UR75_9ACTN|nr:FAD-dependent oxidoreductase [Streptomyces dysideae]KUO15311.1 hypothetical protein AQJ91_42225 [Streptomyces dysideae]